MDSSGGAGVTKVTAVAPFFFQALTVGVCAAAACTDMSDKEAVRRMNHDHPTGISSRWAISSSKTFSGGQPHPTPCEQVRGRRHLLFEC